MRVSMKKNLLTIIIAIILMLCVGCRKDENKVVETNIKDAITLTVVSENNDIVIDEQITSNKTIKNLRI